jgi:hypothetical protein
MDSGLIFPHRVWSKRSCAREEKTHRLNVVEGEDFGRPWRFELIAKKSERPFP